MSISSMRGKTGGRHRRRLACTFVTAAAVAGVAPPALATTTLTVDLSATIRPATHVADGSLYGVIETKPADVNGLIAPLHPNMFNNPAAVGSGRQQPVGDAIVVAGRVAPVGARVTIRLADWFPGWYSFTNMTDWLSKVDMTVARRQAANLTNIYAYEIWNEPNGTWNADANTAGTKPLSFNQMWLQTYQHLRQAEPTIKITGPSLAGYNGTFMNAFLTFCKTNNCLPDIVGWHDGPGIGNNVQSYRNLEKQLGISPLPITINEYSGNGDITDEGRPGASAPIVAAMERGGVETACITFWDVAHPGRLGSLLASDTQTNGGWFFYKWYGEMTGNMVSTKSSLSANGTNLDGFASLDAMAQDASVVLAGINDGTIQIIVKGFSAAPFFGSSVHAVVEHTPWGSRTTVTTATNTLSTSNLAVSNDQVTVTITGANNDDGYHLELTPVNGAGSGSGGATGAAGSSGAGGNTGVAGEGAGGSGGSSGPEGTTGAGGATTGSGGISGSAGKGGVSGTGGILGTGGKRATGGSDGGTSASGGAGESGSATGGVGASAASGGATGTGSGGSAEAGAEASGGCSCAVPRGAEPGSSALILFGLVGAALTRRRRRRSG